MPVPAQLLAQGFAYAVFGALIGYFSSAPVYTHADPELALIKLSFSHAGRPIRECRRLTPEEIAGLAPNMRRPLDCPRERLPLQLELELDGELIHRQLHPPAGLWSDGPAVVYRRFPLPPGRHRLAARLRDSARPEGFDYRHEEDIELRPRQNFVVDFRADKGGFVFR